MKKGVVEGVNYCPWCIDREYRERHARPSRTF